MDEFTQELELMEAIVSAADATVTTRVSTWKDAEAEGRIEAERWEGIRRHVFPLLDVEARHLDADYRRLRYGG